MNIPAPKLRRLLILALLAVLSLPAAASAQGNGVSPGNSGGGQYTPSVPTGGGPEEEPDKPSKTTPKEPQSAGGSDGGGSAPSASIVSPGALEDLSQEGTEPTAAGAGTSEPAPTEPNAEQLAKRKQRQEARKKRAAERKRMRQERRRAERRRQRSRQAADAARTASVSGGGGERIGSVFPILLTVALVGSLLMIVRRRGHLGRSASDDPPLS